MSVSSSALFVMQSFCMLVAIAIAQLLILRAVFREYHNDYLWAAVERAKLFGASVVVVQLLLGVFAVLPVLRIAFRRLAGGFPQDLALSVLAGALIVALASGLERLLSNLFPLDKLDSWAFKGLVWLHSITHQHIGRGMQRLLEQDNIDWHLQRPGFWNCGLTPQQAGRITRAVYEVYKLPIAFERRNPKFLDWDVGIYPGYKFYLVAKHLGRDAFRELLHNPPQFGWGGAERRHKRTAVGTGRRISDKPELRQALIAGEDRYQFGGSAKPRRRKAFDSEEPPPPPPNVPFKKGL